MSNKWPLEHTQLLERNYTDKGWRWVQAELFKRYGKHYSQRAVQNKANYLRKSKQMPEGWYAISQIQKATGAPHQSIIWLIKSKPDLVVRKVNRIWQVDQASFDAIVHHFSCPEGFMRANEAANLLGVSENSISNAAKLGYIQSEKRGRCRYVNQSDIQRGIEYLKRTGNINTPWKKLQQEASKLA